MKKKFLSQRLFLPHKFLIFTLCLSLLLGTTASPVRAATYVVDRTDDSATATDCSDGVNNDCSLRGAIIKANTTGGADVITLPASAEAYTLTIANAPALLDENAAATGDLDITGDLTITGAGADVTTINGGGLDRVFESRPAAGITLTINISGVTITGGNVSGAGFIGGAFGDRGTTTGVTNLTMSEVVIKDNTTNNNGGGIGLKRNNLGTTKPSLTLDRSMISNNTANNGGGISCDVCAMNITNSAITGNNAATTGGGIYVAGSTTNITLVNSTISGNMAKYNGGGIGQFLANGTVLINFSTITNNVTDNDNNATGDGGGIYAQAGFTIQNSIVQGNWKGSTSPVANDCGVTVASGGYNVFGTGCPSGDITDTTSLANLGALADNGGPTESHMPSGSAAIDRIPNGTNGCVAGTTTDQRSVVRGIHGSTSCDSGAIEADATPSYRQCSLSVGRKYNMGPGVYFQADTLGTLGSVCVTITHYSTNHDYATTRLQTGKYWNIDGAGATGFSVSLTLPDSLTIPVICKYLGSSNWDCDRTYRADNGGSVTRTHIDSLSDWTVGENPGATAVQVDRFGVSQAGGWAGWGLLGAAAVIGLLAILLRRRKYPA